MSVTGVPPSSWRKASVICSSVKRLVRIGAVSWRSPGAIGQPSTCSLFVSSPGPRIREIRQEAMGRTKYTQEKILAVLKEAEAVPAVADSIRKHGIGQDTFYRWKPCSFVMTPLL